MSDLRSQISTTTQIALQPPQQRNPRKTLAADPVAPPTLSKATKKPVVDLDLMQSHLDLSKQFIGALQKQIKHLEQEVSRLKEFCRENNSCSIIVFGPPNDLSVAAITNNSSEGIDFCSRVSEQFEKNAQQLHKRGISYAVIEDVPLNRMYDTPFSKT
jgi:hypothetical protein